MSALTPQEINELDAFIAKRRALRGLDGAVFIDEASAIFDQKAASEIINRAAAHCATSAPVIAAQLKDFSQRILPVCQTIALEFANVQKRMISQNEIGGGK